MRRRWRSRSRWKYVSIGSRSARFVAFLFRFQGLHLWWRRMGFAVPMGEGLGHHGVLQHMARRYRWPIFFYWMPSGEADLLGL